VLFELIDVEASLTWHKHLSWLGRVDIVVSGPHRNLTRQQPADLLEHVVCLLDLIDDEQAAVWVRLVVRVSSAHRCSHERDGVGGLAGSGRCSHYELLRFLERAVAGFLRQRPHTGLKDAATNLSVDPCGELSGLLAVAFDLGNRLRVGYSQADSTGHQG
jgi:hypothetical protein